MEIITLSGGIFDSNTYILSDKDECAVVDCGVAPDRILKTVQDKGLKLRYIILTHGHVDHVMHVEALKKATNAPICIHKEELPLYQNPEYNGFLMFGFGNSELPAPDKVLNHGDKLALGNMELEIIHTPGHSPGSISILFGQHLLTGDTLFASSVGRTDLFGGSMKSLTESILNRLFTLDGDIMVYPGHGPSTTIDYERESNPYV